jgi:hypothetical protein
MLLVWPMKNQIYNRTLSLKTLCVLALYFINGFCFATENPKASNTILPSADYVSISIDEIVVDTHGLTQMTNQLLDGIESLSNSIEQLSTSSSSFNEQDRQTIVAATTSINNASQAISNLSRQLPLAIQGLTRELPDALKKTQSQISAISKSIQSASKAAIHINDSFPDALSKGKLAAKEITVGIMQKITLYVGLILLMFALVLAVVMYIIYKASIQPIAVGLSELRAVPEQLSDMSAYMHNTSENLLNLEQQQSIRTRRSRSTMNKSKIGRLK